MIIGPRYKICRRLGNGVFEKCQSQSYLLSEARHQKNQSRGRGKNVSNFGKQLMEKQKVRLAYGVPEKQLRRYIEEAQKRKQDSIPVDKLQQILEQRLDNVVFRVGLAPSRRMARQLVSHGHITVNGRKVTIPSFSVSEKDAIAVRNESKQKPVFEAAQARLAEVKAPHWISFDTKAMTGTIVASPNPENIDSVADLGAVIEFYSR